MKKGQMFTVDFILGLVGFIFLLLLAIKIILSILPSTAYEDVYRNNLYVSEQLVQDGYPLDSTPASVVMPGLTNNYLLNETKLALFNSISYERTKTLFRISNDYIFFFKTNDGILNLSSCLYGYPLSYNTTTCEPDLSSIHYANLVTTQRFIGYNASLVQLVVYSWN